VETRKRRLERWEKAVLDLGEVLSTTISDLAMKARSAQQLFRWTAELVGQPALNQDQVKRDLAQLRIEARDVTDAFHDLLDFRSRWLFDSVSMYRSSDMVVEFKWAFRHYQLHMTELAPGDWQEVPGERFDAWWDTERKLRAEMSAKIRQLAHSKHPLRTSLRMRGRRLRYRARDRWKKIGAKPAEVSASPGEQGAVPDPKA